jgi:hypothetical protein
LHCAFFEKCSLHGVELFTARKTFNGGDFLLGNGFGSCDARPLGSSIDQDGAGSALTLPAAVLGSHQIKVLAQYREKAGLRIGVDRAGASVDSKVNRSHCDHSSLRTARKNLRPFSEMIVRRRRHLKSGLFFVFGIGAGDATVMAHH